MYHSAWCEHLDKRSKFTVVDYRSVDGVTLLRVQSWYCPECGVHGAATEIIARTEEAVPTAASQKTEQVI